MDEFLKQYLGTSGNRAIGFCLGVLHAQGRITSEELSARWDGVEIAADGAVTLLGRRPIVVFEAPPRPTKKKTARKKA